MLYTFIDEHRDEILKRAIDLVQQRDVPRPNRAEVEFGVPMFVNQLSGHLRAEAGLPAAAQAPVPGIGATATQHGGDLQRLGVSAAGVVKDYGAICSVITDMADEAGATITTREFHALNQCLDVATAEAIAEHAAAGDRARVEREAEHIGALAHELRNALATVTLAVGSIVSGAVGSSGRTAALAQRALMRMNDLINRSLSEVRLAGAPDLRREQFRVAEVWDEIADTLAVEARPRNVKIKVDIGNQILCVADRHLFASALFNLVQNAIRYTAPATCVSVLARERDGNVEISVGDACGGLEKDAASRIFEPFVRGSPTTKGTGLGLSIVRSIANAHGWQVRVDDRPGVGCVFWLVIPTSES